MAWGWYAESPHQLLTLVSLRVCHGWIVIFFHWYLYIISRCGTNCIIFKNDLILVKFLIYGVIWFGNSIIASKRNLWKYRQPQLSAHCKFIVNTFLFLFLGCIIMSRWHSWRMSEQITMENTLLWEEQWFESVIQSLFVPRWLFFALHVEKFRVFLFQMENIIFPQRWYHVL